MTDRTALQSERLAVVIAVAAVAAVALEVGDGFLALAIAGGIGTTLALRRVDADTWTDAVGARTLGALGVLAGAVGVVGAASAAASIPAALAVGIGAWTAAVGAVAAVDDRPDRRSALGWATFAAGGLLVAAATLGVGSVIAGGAVSETVGGVLLAVPLVLVFGGGPQLALPLLFGLAATLCGVWLVVLVTVPRHVLLPAWGDEFHVVGLDRLTNWLLGGAVLFAVLAVGLYSVGLLPAFVGPLAVVERLVRALLVLGVLIAVPVGLLGATIPRWYGGSDRSLRAAGLSIAAGVAAATVVVAAIALRPPETLYGPSGALVLAGVVGVATVPLRVLARWASARTPVLADGVRHLSPVGLLLAAVGAAQYGVIVAPIVCVAAALVCWDALALRNTLRSEVPGADASSVERFHLGPTVGIAVIGALAALAVYGGAAAIAREVRGQPLVVVVVGAVVLALLTAALARTDPSS